MGRYTREFGSYVELPSFCLSRLCQMPCGAQLDRRDGQHAAHYGPRDTRTHGGLVGRGKSYRRDRRHDALAAVHDVFGIELSRSAPSMPPQAGSVN
jgi:hypothetical protein